MLKFTDVTKTVATTLQNIGLICDAISTDYNNDGWPDLIIAGEWMPIIFLKNQHGTFINETAASGIGNEFGWWNSQTHYIAGNLGENSFFNGNEKFPINNYYNDFDKNGTFESITTKFMKDKDGSYKEYPAESRDEVVAQLPFLKKKFITYKSFAEATIDQLFNESQLSGSLKSHANYFSCSYLHNLGNGKFEMKPLPAIAQLAPVFGMIADDFNKDGNTDILLCENDYGAEVSNGRLDASNGLLLQGDGKGNFTPLSIQQSGFYLPGNGKSLTAFKSADGHQLVAATQNRGFLKVFLVKK